MVVLLLTVGVDVVLLQHIPFEVIIAPPSLLIFPPLIAEFCEMELTLVVVSPVGIVALVVLKLTVVPYAVPTLFVA